MRIHIDTGTLSTETEAKPTYYALFCNIKLAESQMQKPSNGYNLLYSIDYNIVLS